MNTHTDISFPFVSSTDQGDHPPHLQLHQQCSSAEGRRPSPLCPGSDGGPAGQSEEQRAEEQIPTSAGTPQQGPHTAVTARKHPALMSLRNIHLSALPFTLFKFENKGWFIYSCTRTDSIVIQPFFLSFLSVRFCRFVSLDQIPFWCVGPKKKLSLLFGIIWYHKPAEVAAVYWYHHTGFLEVGVL